MNKADPLTGLIGPRLGEPGIAEALAAFAFGLLAVLFLSLLSHLYRQARNRRAHQHHNAMIDAALALPTDERTIALLRLAQSAAEKGAMDQGQHAGSWRARAASDLRVPITAFGEPEALYRPSGNPDVDHAALARALRALGPPMLRAHMAKEGRPRD